MRYLLLSLLIITVSCHTKSKKSPIIPQERFISLLMDYHLANAISYTHVFDEKTAKYKEYNIKDSVLKNHGYTRADFDSTVAYYATVPDKFEIIYDSVITRLSRMQANVQKGISEKTERERKKSELLHKSHKSADSIPKSTAVAPKSPIIARPFLK